MKHPRTHRLLRLLVIVLIVAFVLINIEAAIQARALTHFQAIDGRSPRVPELSLSLLARTVTTGVPIPRPRNRHTPAEHHLPFETRQIQLNTTEFLEAWYIPNPQSRGIVLSFSGYINVKDALLTPVAHFYQLGYSSLMVDFRGSGGSSGNDTTLGLREADDVAAAFTYAQLQWPNQPIIVYGISMGGAAVLRAIAVNDIQPAAAIIEGVFDTLLTTARHRFHAIGAPASPASELLIFWGSVQIGYNGFAHNPVEYATQVTVPTLVMAGERDPWVHLAEMQALFDALTGPKQLILFPNIGHTMPFVHKDEQRWVEAVRTFLSPSLQDEAIR